MNKTPESDPRNKGPSSSPDDPTMASDSGGAKGEANIGGMPRRIARYEIKRIIASGGMGTVFEAIQDQPKRSVAIKVMKHGMVSPASLKRFEIESQLLARLRHPGIAQVYEAGTYDDGTGLVPFFAMEYIPNAKPINEYANEKGLNIQERLELFAEVCDAVHHGHQRGVIHRDLKPSNILVDSNGRPRIIDFGVARSLDAELVHQSIQTEYGQLVGSLPYMSPEQFEADPNDLDTRSDVYSLGVVLYQLLTGQLPYTLEGATLYKAAGIVRDESVIKPGQVKPALRGDVETIIIKALEKDRARRYQSAFGFAQDINRFLSGEAIVARPPSVSYQVQVFARKNKLLIGSLAAVFAVLVAGVAVSASLFFKAAAERDRAEIEAVRAQSSSKFLMELLTEAMPHGYGDKFTVHDLLDLSKDRIADAFPHDPELEAEIRITNGWGYLNVSMWEDGEEQFRKAYELRKGAFGEAHEKTIEAMHGMELVYELMGRHDELVEMRGRIVELESQVFGPDKDPTLTTRSDYVSALEAAGRLRQAAETAEENLAICQRALPKDAPETLTAHQQYSWMLFRRGDIDEAEAEAKKAYQQALAGRGEGQIDTRTAKSLLATILISQGRIEECKELYREKSLPENFGVVKTYQGSGRAASSGTQILVFWEAWCPFSQRAVPSLERIHQQYRSQGLDVLGLTRVNRSSSDEMVMDFIKDTGITYSIVQENGSAWSYFDCRGTPWVIVAQDGVMIWENVFDIPEQFPEIMLEQLVRAKSG